MAQVENIPEEIRLSKDKETLVVLFEGKSYPMSAEYLRVCSPSAEVRGHGGDWKIVAGKKSVKIMAVEPVGQYAVRIIFDDQHHSGIYDWNILYDLAMNHRDYWQRYLQSLQEFELTREA